MTTLPWQPPDEQARRLLTERVESYDVDATTMTWWERLLAWLNDATAMDVASSGAGGILVTVLLILAVVTLAILLIRYFRPGRATPHNQHPEHLVDPDRTAAAYLHQAQRSLADHRYDAAYLDAFRFLVRTATERGLLEVTPATTATVFGRSLAAVLPAHRAEIETTAQFFNAISYGSATPTRDDAEAALALGHQVATSPGRVMPQ